METQFNNLTPAEAERLFLLMEECAEVIQIIGKILRHGYESYHPDRPNITNITNITNRSDLEKELGHVVFAQSMLVDENDLSIDMISGHAFEKQAKISKYLHHQ